MAGNPLPAKTRRPRLLPANPSRLVRRPHLPLPLGHTGDSAVPKPTQSRTSTPGNARRLPCLCPTEPLPCPYSAGNTPAGYPRRPRPASPITRPPKSILGLLLFSGIPWLPIPQVTEMLHILRGMSIPARAPPSAAVPPGVGASRTDSAARRKHHDRA